MVDQYSYALVFLGFVKAVTIGTPEVMSQNGAAYAQLYRYPSGTWIQSSTPTVSVGWEYRGGQLIEKTPAFSKSGADAAISVAAGDTLAINLDGDGARTITLAASSAGAGIALDIKNKVRALTAIDPGKQASYDNFMCDFSPGNDQYWLILPYFSGHSVVVAGGAAAASLKLGAGNGGVETAGVGE